MHQFTLAVALQHEQHSFCAGELGGFFDDKRVKRFGGALRVEAQPRIREALEGLADIGLDREMREKALLRKLAFRSGREPSRDDCAIERNLVEIVAAQTFVAQMRDPVDKEAVRPFEGFVRLLFFVARRQRLRMPPPYLLRSPAVRLGEGMRAMHGRCFRSGLQRGSMFATSELGVPEL